MPKIIPWWRKNRDHALLVEAHSELMMPRGLEHEGWANCCCTLSKRIRQLEEEARKVADADAQTEV